MGLAPNPELPLDQISCSSIELSKTALLSVDAFAYSFGIGTILLAIYFLCCVIDDYEGLFEVSCVMIFIGVLMIAAATLTKQHPKDEF